MKTPVNYQMVERILKSEGYHIGDSCDVTDPRYPQTRARPGSKAYGDWLDNAPDVTVFGWWTKGQRGGAPAIMTMVDTELGSLLNLTDESRWRVLEIEVQDPKNYLRYMKVKMTADNIRKWARYWASS